MSNALSSDIEARAEQRRTRTRATMWQDLAQRTWCRAQDAADPVEARRWLGRAHRLLPQDDMIGLALAGSMVGLGEVAAATTLFQAIADRHGTAEAWAGLATCGHLSGNVLLARTSLAAGLRCSVPTATLQALATMVAGPAGWCGLTTAGVLIAGMPLQSVWLDGAPLRLRRGARRLTLPDGWRTAAVLEVDGVGGPMLGSPLAVQAIAGLEGFVEARNGGLVGWAWHQADPEHDPTVLVQGTLGAVAITPTEPAEELDLDRPLSRPRHFALTTAEVADLGEPLALVGPDGRHLLGSPLEPGIEARAAAGGPGFAPVWADVVGPPPQARPLPPQPVAVVIPVYRGARETLGCIGSVLASVSRDTRVIVVDDASPDAALVDALQDLARSRRIVLLRLPENRGFPGAANAGLRAAAGRDVVLLNSDTLVPPGWLVRLRKAAYSAPDIGTATPFSNDGTILSYPDPAGGNPVPDLAATIALDTVAYQANAGAVAELPVGVGFCLYVRRECLDAIGVLREDLFAQGYGEENDLCLRARHHGWRNVAALDVFVGHAGATSFGNARAHLCRRNGAILERLHPGYDALVARHVARDPLAPARQRMDMLRWAAGRSAYGAAVVLVTHGGGGGVDRVVLERAAAIRVAGDRPIVLRPAPGPGVRVEQPGAEPFPNLVFSMPDGLAALAEFLRADRPSRVEIHHLLGHHHDIATLPDCLGVEAVSVVHDYARFCSRITLVGTGRRYCGEPDVAGCEDCIADLGSLLEDEPLVPTLLARSATELRRAARIVAPSRDTAVRIARHFPGIHPAIEPWEDDLMLPALAPAPQDGPLRVIVVGAIGVEKGFEVLLACIRDARARRLPIAFTVVGFTADDERLMASGPAFVTGEYAEAEAVALIQAQRGQIALIPSIWPETWCFALSRAWQAGLPAAVFDIGAQSERVRSTGRGWILPLGLPPHGLNDALLRLASGHRTLQCPPH